MASMLYEVVFSWLSYYSPENYVCVPFYQHLTMKSSQGTDTAFGQHLHLHCNATQRRI